MKMDIGKRFFDARAKKHESVRVVYEKTGVPASSITMYENNKRLPNMENAQKLADHYGVNVLWLLGQSDSPSLDESSQIVTKVTGLSAESVRILQTMKPQLLDSLNALIESDAFMVMLNQFNVARIINLNNRQTEEQAKAIEELQTWGIVNGMDSSNNRLSNRQLIDLYRRKALESTDNAFHQIMKGDKNNGKR